MAPPPPAYAPLLPCLAFCGATQRSRPILGSFERFAMCPPSRVRGREKHAVAQVVLVALSPHPQSSPHHSVPCPLFAQHLHAMAHSPFHRTALLNVVSCVRLAVCSCARERTKWRRRGAIDALSEDSVVFLSRARVPLLFLTVPFSNPPPPPLFVPFCRRSRLLSHRRIRCPPR